MFSNDALQPGIGEIERSHYIHIRLEIFLTQQSFWSNAWHGIHQATDRFNEIHNKTAIRSSEIEQIICVWIEYERIINIRRMLCMAKYIIRQHQTQGIVLNSS